MLTGSAMAGRAILVVRPEDALPAQDYLETVLTGHVFSVAFLGRC
ncbi:MAG: hypothetical protein ABI832_24465 [bacterium]